MNFAAACETDHSQLCSGLLSAQTVGSSYIIMLNTKVRGNADVFLFIVFSKCFETPTHDTISKRLMSAHVNISVCQ